MRPYRLETGEPITDDYVHCVLRANVQNYVLSKTFVESSSYFFCMPSGFNQKTVQKITRYLGENHLSHNDLMGPFIADVENINESEWKSENLHKIVEIKSEEDRARWTTQMRIVRLLLTGGASGPSVADTMAVLGKKRTVQRLKNTEHGL